MLKLLQLKAAGWTELTQGVKVKEGQGHPSKVQRGLDVEQTSSLRAHPAEHLWFGDKEEVKGCNNHVCMLVTKPSPLSALPWPCLKHRSFAEQVCNSYALDFLISFPLLGKFGLGLPVTWILKVRQKSLLEKKSSYLNSSQILLRSKASRNLVTYAVL